MKLHKRVKPILFLPLLLVLVFACQDDMTGTWESKNKEWNETIERAKEIFAECSPDFPCVQSRGLSDIRKSIVFEPLWDEAFITRHADGSITAEAHIRLSKPLIIVPNESYEAYLETKDVRYLQYLSRAVVLMKEMTVPQAFLMTIVGSKEYMETHEFQLWDVSYRNIPEDFSGMILYHTLSGEFVNGWYVDEGWNFTTCNPISPEDAQLLSRSGSNCYIYEFSYVAVDCVTNSGYNTYEGSDEIFFWVNTACGEPYRVIESYQVCDDDIEGGSGSSSGGEIIGGGGSSTSGGTIAPNAKAIFRNSNMTDANWQIIENMVNKIILDCMGQNLYNRLKAALNGGTLIIQFGTGNSTFGPIGQGYGITLSMDMESNQLLHEMMHAYRAYKETASSYNNSMLNGEIEAWYAQYLYVKKLPEYKESKWEKKYKNKPLSKDIKQLERYINNKGEMLSGIAESQLNNYISNQLVPVFWNSSTYCSYSYDMEGRTSLDNFKNLKELMEGCL